MDAGASAIASTRLPSSSSPNSEEVGPRVSRGILSGCATMGNSECGVTDIEPIRLEVDFDVSRDLLMLNIVELLADNCVVL